MFVLVFNSFELSSSQITLWDFKDFEHFSTVWIVLKLSKVLSEITLNSSHLRWRFSNLRIGPSFNVTFVPVNWPFVAEHIARERILGFSTQDLITEMNECNWYNRHANNKTVSCLTLHSISGMNFQVTLILTFELNCFEFEKVMKSREIGFPN